MRQSGVVEMVRGESPAGRKLSRARSIQTARARPATPPASDERKAFDQQLGHDARAAGAQRETDGDLFLAGGGAGDQQIRDVGAGDQEHQADNGSEDQQRAGELAAQAGIAFGGGEELDPHGQECSGAFPERLGEILLLHFHFEDLMEERLQTSLGLFQR